MRRSLNALFCGTIRTWELNGRWWVSRFSPQKMLRGQPFREAEVFENEFFLKDANAKN